MNVDEILSALNEERVDYLLIGGMNFLLRHLPELTFDVDMLACQQALPPGEQKIRRMEILREAIRQSRKPCEP